MDKLKKAKNYIMDIKKPMMIFVIVMLGYHVLMRELSIGDAHTFFSQVMNQYSSIFSYLSFRFDTWTSRMLIEAVLVFFANHFVLWKIVNILMMVWLFFSITYFFDYDKKQNMMYVMLGLFLVYPLEDMATAGWIATTTNALWPLACAFYGLCVIVKIEKGIKIRAFEYVTFFLAILYATNMEQVNVIYFMLLVSVIGYYGIVKKKIYPILLVQLVANILNLILMAVCPGNDVRYQAEISRALKNFGMYTVFDKMNLGINNAFIHMMTRNNAVFLSFCVLLMILTFYKTKHMGVRLIAIIPAACNLIFMFFNSDSKKYYLFHELGLSINISNRLTAANYATLVPYVVMGFIFFLFLCVIITFVVIADNYLDFLIYTWGLCLAVGSYMMMGFSPTIYESQTRTMLYFYFIIIFLIGLMIHKNYEIIMKDGKGNAVLKYMFASIVALSTLNTIFQIIQIH